MSFSSSSDRASLEDSEHSEDSEGSEGSGESEDWEDSPGVDSAVDGASYDEQFFPARPSNLRLRPRARLRGAGAQSAATSHVGEPSGENPFYVAWLVEASMLNDAERLSPQFSGRASMWQNPFAAPGPRAAVQTASTWFTAYPLSLVTRPTESFLATLGSADLWSTFERIGIEAVHTGPVKLAGGIRGWDRTPSVDGHFDRISTHLDPAFGSEEEFRAMTQVAGAHGGTVIDDIVPGHTGKGADFRLAEMKYADYAGIYHMVEIPESDWHLLPDVAPGHDAANLSQAAEAALEAAGHIIGRLQRVIFYAPGVKESNWSATCKVLGVDGKTRRWVYLHYFKEGQPSVNWLDPTFAGMRLVIGDALHSLGDLGSGALRLDANGFLGVEKSAGGLPAWSEGHPLSEAANQLIAGMIRKVGGFSFQELNLTFDDIRSNSESGADLSYDFVNRPAYHHALVTADTEFLRLTLRSSRQFHVDPASLVHALQNHDELTYELVHFATLHKDDRYDFRGEDLDGGTLAETIRQDLLEGLTGPAAPYNLVFTTNGISCTTASVITAVLGIPDLARLTADDVERVKRAHLLLAMFNALQPGVFALSGWDLTGMLPVEAQAVQPLIANGDTRWIHRPAHDLMGVSPEATRSAAGMPRSRSLYGTLPEQLADDESFAARLSHLLAVRKRYGIAVSNQVDVPAVSQPSMLVMVHQLPEPGQVQLTVLNFAAHPVSGSVRSEFLCPGSPVVDMLTEETIADVDGLHSFGIVLGAHQGMSLLTTRPAPG